MRTPSIAGRDALGERMRQKAQVTNTSPEAELPPALESFLAHIRLLVGVPFDYLVPDARLLPPESIRFFYLDRSFTDRLVDGALAVGKIGTRDQAHHQAQHPAVQQSLDLVERGVRPMQIGQDFASVRRVSTQPAGVVTGFLLRSAAVAGWPNMDVRAFDTILTEPIDSANATAHQLRTLRLERLSPSVIIALFEGVPALVWCEEPHHGVQFGVDPDGTGFSVLRHLRSGAIEQPPPPPIPVPMRAGNRRVVSMAGLRRAIASTGDTNLPAQSGSAALAIELLSLPWRQRFEGAGGPDLRRTHSGPVSVGVVAKVADADTRAQLMGLIGK
jgi:hypothetical protein